MPQPVLYFVRHGETDWNRERRLQGQHDIPLNDRGRAQAVRCGEILRELFARAHGNIQAVFPRRHRTVVGRVEQAEGVISAVEVEVVDARRGAIEIEVAAARICFGAVGAIEERDEQPSQLRVTGVGERGQLQRFPLERELERADSPHVPALTGRGRHFQDVFHFAELERRRDPVLLVRWKVGKFGERGPLRFGNGRLRRAHEAILLGAPRPNLFLVGELSRAAARRGAGEKCGECGR